MPKKSTAPSLNPFWRGDLKAMEAIRYLHSVGVTADDYEEWLIERKPHAARGGGK